MTFPFPFFFFWIVCYYVDKRLEIFKLNQVSILKILQKILKLEAPG